ncbi:MAG: biotin/lipoyl-binding protein [Bacteroidales bacterium]|nr:biotin/lipoyl-binding protein [Bacteroidales bacterium]
MKRFNITVNGKAYDVAVEELAEGTPVVANAAPIVAQQPAPVATPAPTPVAAAGSGTKITAPMPGTILDVKVAVGDSVTKGQPIIVLEAMKMENDIVAPCDGKVTSVLVKKNDTVNSSDTLATIQ